MQRFLVEGEGFVFPVAGAAKEIDPRLERARIALDGAAYDACVSLCDQLLAEQPDLPPALYMAGVARFRRGEPEVGTAMIGRAASLSPDNILLRVDHANSLQAMGLTHAAAQMLLEGLQRHGPHPEIALRLSQLFADAGQHHKAQQLLVESIAAHPTRTDLCCQLASELAADLRIQEAMTLMRLAAELCGMTPAIHSSLAVLEQAKGNLEAALPHYEAAIAIEPDAPLAHANMATALLMGLDFERGFQEAEWRLKTKNMRVAPVEAPRWQGESLTGKSLLLTAEQGFGDMIQYSRFIPRLLAYGAGEVIVECHEGLERLFARLPGVSRCLPISDAPLPSTDYTIPLVSLPLVVGCDRAFLEASVPYFDLPPPMRLPDAREGCRKVGLVWTSRPAFGEVFARRMLNRRNCPLEHLIRFDGIEGLQLYSLQKGYAVDQLQGAGLTITDLSPRLGDFADTAAAIAALDLVITVDTSVAHLTAALGKPVWIMLSPGQMDYRWGLEETTPWYPRARLYRGGTDGWAGLTARIARDLKKPDAFEA